MNPILKAYGFISTWILRMSLYKQDCIDDFITNANVTTNNLPTNPVRVRIEDIAVIRLL